eukprot:4937-Heterococcus_DN1.PRE.1
MQQHRANVQCVLSEFWSHHVVIGGVLEGSLEPEKQPSWWCHEREGLKFATMVLCALLAYNVLRLKK